MLKKILLRLLVFILILLTLFIILLFITALFISLKDYNKISWELMQLSLKTKTKEICLISFAFSFCLSAAASIFYFFIWKKQKQKEGVVRSKLKDYGDADFLINEKEPKTKSNLNEFQKVYPQTNNEVGWVVKSKFENNKTKYWISSCDKSGHHNLVIGATSSGKTQKTILQSIAYNAQIQDLKKKPSMIIFDPKGEIASLQTGFLKENGYDILVFNLSDTFRSSCWNPLYLATETYFDAKLLEKDINFKKEKLLNEIEDIKLEYENNGDDNLLQKLETKEKELEHLMENNAVVMEKLNSTDEMINDIAIALYTNKDSKDKFWEEQAKGVFLFIYYLMLETLEIKYLENKNINEIDLDGLKKEYANVNLPSIAAELANVKGCKKYFDGVNEIGSPEYQLKFKSKKSYINGSTPFGSGENTLGSIMATVGAGIEQYKQSTIQNITTTNEIILKELAQGDKPKALFIIVPDEKENSYKFATLFIDQIYKANIGFARECPNQKLPRSLMFYLDEFGNIPTIPKFDTMITVSRSRGIYFCIAIQGFNQIDAKYGKDQAKVIIENMLLHIYVSSTDMDTIKYYQQKAGTYTITKIGISESCDNFQKNSASKSIDKKELMTLDEIKDNPSDMLLVFFPKVPVSWVKTDAYWKCNDLHNNRIALNQLFNGVRIFKFEEHYFNVLNFWNYYFSNLESEIEYKQLYQQLINDNDINNKKRYYIELKKLKCFNIEDFVFLEYFNELEQFFNEFENEQDKKIDKNLDKFEKMKKDFYSKKYKNNN